jgi:hypothetical protein
VAYKDMGELKKAVDDKGDGLLEVSMEDVRKAAKVGRLGTLVRLRIAKKDLPDHGLGHLPADELPKYQREKIRLYSRSSPVGQLIIAMLEPTTEGDKLLRAAASSSGSKAQEQLQRVREDLATILEQFEMNGEE